MQKLILHFGEDHDEKKIYGLLVKAIDISSEKEFN
jgi:hypothetical protein